MGQTRHFDYFYGIQAGMYSFYRIPKILFTHSLFKDLSCEAKTLYGLMLERMSLSIKNKWFDDQGRVYIIFTVTDVREYLACCRQTVINLLAALDTDKVIGLIEKKRLGFGKANIIYLKNLVTQAEAGKKDSDRWKAGNCESEAGECAENADGFEKPAYDGSDNMAAEVPETEHAESENNASRCLENRLLEVQKTDTSKTNTNYTEKNETESYPSDLLIYPSNSSIRDRLSTKRRVMDDEVETRMAYKKVIYENIEYEALCSMYGKDRIDEVVTLMLDTVCMTRGKLIINGDAVLSEWVRSRLLKLDYFHIQYVLNCLDNNTTKVRNIRQYMLTALYNAISTMNHYYSAEVNHDMYGDGSA